MKKTTLISLLISPLFFTLSACGGGSDGPAGDAAKQGVFVDSPVQGLFYSSGELSGFTDSDGTFEYQAGQSVIFSIGDVVLGTAQGADMITPLELVSGAVDENDPTVINILRLLQTLDEDGNADNGIEITALMRDLAGEASLNFRQSIEDFANDGEVQTFVSELTSVGSAGARTLIDADDALTHFQATLAGVQDNEPSSVNGGNESIITLSGSDSSAIGTELVLSEYSYSVGTGGADGLLIATSTGILPLITEGSGSVSPDLLANNVVMNLFTIGGQVGISMQITRSGNEYEYVLNLASSPIEFDAANRRITLNNAQLQPAGNEGFSTAPITLNGTLSWSASDEDADPLNETPADNNDNGYLPTEITISLSGDDVANGLISNSLVIPAHDISGIWTDDPGDIIMGFSYTNSSPSNTSYSRISFSGEGLIDSAIQNPEIKLGFDTPDGNHYDYACETDDVWLNRPDCLGVTFEQVGDIITVIFDNTTLAPQYMSIGGGATGSIVINGTLQRDVYDQ